MKKILSLLVGVAICLTVNIRPASATLGQIFAENSATIGGASMVLDASSTRAQTITAGVSHLMRFDAYLKDRVDGSLVRAYLINESSQEVMAESGHRMDAGDGWEEFGFDALLDKESVYRVKLIIPYDTAEMNVKWPYNSNNPYAGGFLYFGVNDDDMASDFNFKAWGYDADVTPDTPISGVPDDSTAASTSTTPATSTEAPATATSSSISKPSALKAEYTTGVQLSWTASTTTDIDGYVIFRSETKGKSYAKVGQVVKAKLEYLDTTVTASKTYYYVVRAYKGTSQSTSSNEATLTVPTAATTATAAETVKKTVSPVETSIIDSGFGQNVLILAGVALLLLLLLIAYEIYVYSKRKEYTFSKNSFKIAKRSE